jgi:P-type Cu+ transporter
MKTYNFPVEGMTCASCVSRVEKIISKFDGIANVNVNLANEHVTFETVKEVDLNSLARAVEEYGYKLKLQVNQSQTAAKSISEESLADEHYLLLKKDFLLALIFTIPLFALSMLMDFDFFHHNWPLSEDYTHKLFLILATPIIFISGKRFYKIFLKNLKHLSFEMNSLVAIGTASAYGYSALATLFPDEFSNSSNTPHVYFETAGVIITLILMGKLLEDRAKKKTNDAIRKLMELKPKSARIIQNTIEKEIPLADLQKEHIVIIRPGEKIPADGIIISGSSVVDESMITGESIPVEKTTNSKVIGGTINKNGSFNFKVTEVGDNTVLAQIIKLVEQAQSSKPPIQKLVDKVAAVFVPSVIILALITFIGWLIVGSENTFTNALINFVAVLIVACPCALGLATPTAIIVSTGLGASNGILIRNGESLEIAKNISTIIFDKTGTLTEGKPEVSEIIPIDSSEEEILFIAASLESKSEHPLALSITNEAKRKKIQLTEPDSFASQSGFGITGIVNGKIVLVGNKNLLTEFSINTKALKQADSLNGKTLIYVAAEGELKGIIAVEDKIKDSSANSLLKLKEMKIKTVMITGDNFKSAQSIAIQLGIDEFKAEVLPEGKAEIVKQYQKQNQIVAMVGDGINDSPALAQADVGIAIGTGTDVAIETAQITLVQGNLISVAKAINLSKGTIKTIKQNLFWAFFYNVILIPLAAFGKLNPMMAALAMSLSSVSVVTNSLRLKNTRI